jgi:ubiquitin-conjugating enzyme E2 variant
VPRTFKLYEELEKAEKGHLSDSSVSYGLDKGDDKSFTYWNGSIIGPPGTNFDNRIYFLTIRCGEDYPVRHPVIKFSSKINIPSVNQSNGNVEARFKVFQDWKPDMGMETCLIALKNEMLANKKLPQPADGDMYA